MLDGKLAANRMEGQDVVDRAWVEPLEARVLLAGGDLDTTFAFGVGYTSSKFVQNAQNDGFDVALQSNNSVVVAASAGDDAYVVNYTGRGKFNPTFGAGGIAKINFGASLRDVAFGVVLQDDGRIVVVGTTVTSNGSDSDIWIARYLAGTGKTDKTFFTVGYRRLTGADFATAQRVYYDSVADKILVVGSSASLATGGGLTVWRFNLDGQLDSTFGVGGVFKTNPGPGKVDMGTDIVRTSDGNYVIAGARLSYNGAGFTGSQAMLVKTNNTGTPVAGFGVAGFLVAAAFQNIFEFYTRVQQGPGNKLYAAGTTANGVHTFGTKVPLPIAMATATVANWIFLRALLANGAPDNTFSGDGRHIVDFGAGFKDGLSFASVQTDGSIIAGGGSGATGQNSRMVTARLLTTGVLDPLWGVGGLAVLAFVGLSAGFFGMRLFANGVLYATGHHKSSGSIGSVILARLNAGGNVQPAMVRPKTPALDFGINEIKEEDVLG